VHCFGFEFPHVDAEERLPTSEPTDGLKHEDRAGQPVKKPVRPAPGDFDLNREPLFSALDEEVEARAVTQALRLQMNLSLKHPKAMALEDSKEALFGPLGFN